VRAARDEHEFLANPRGLYVRGHGFVIWVLDETLAGSAYFGRPDERDFPTLLGFAELPLHPALADSFDALVDCSSLAGLDGASFQVLVGYIAHVTRAAARLRRVAVVRPPGVVGATIAGLFYEAVRPSFPAGLFADRVEAFHWLGRSDAECRAVETMLERAHALPVSIVELRRWLQGHLHHATIAEAAQGLAQSPRSLQRRLGEAGTTFRAEVDRARVRAAEALLVDGDTKIEAIACAVGCSSAWRFGATFRRVTGESPRDFRERRRGLARRE
jgi:AraC-like DNA-binding protein